MLRWNLCNIFAMGFGKGEHWYRWQYLGNEQSMEINETYFEIESCSMVSMNSQFTLLPYDYGKFGVDVVLRYCRSGLHYLHSISHSFHFLAVRSLNEDGHETKRK